jgi:hypothetical protein
MSTRGQTQTLWIGKLQSFQETDYLTWEYSTDPDIQYIDCPKPTPVRNHLPKWFKELRGNLQEYLPEGFGDQHTIRHCLGFRGLLDIGYTIPLPETLDGYDTYFARGHLHPAMLYGTHWANKGDTQWADDDYSLYEYRVKLLHWPWRARMNPGWRMIILPYLLDWSTDWNEFAGAVEPNYNYYNIETVLAYKRTAQIDKGTVTFCAVPLFDPVLYTEQTGKTL